MSLADDKSLLAMKAASMGTGSIAFTLRWTERRVDRRLGELLQVALAAAGFAPAGAVAVPMRPCAPPRRPADANPVRRPAPVPERPDRPLADGEGLVTRTFALACGGRGAAVLLADRRLVFTEVGHADPKLTTRVQVQPAGGCFRLATAAKTEA